MVASITSTHVGQPGDPASISPTLVTEYNTQYQSRNVLHWPLGSSNPDVTLREPAPRQGRLAMLFTTEESAFECVEFHRHPARFTFIETDRPSFAMDYVLGEGSIELSLEDQTRRLFIVAVPYQEVLA